MGYSTTVIIEPAAQTRAPQRADELAQLIRDSTNRTLTEGRGMAGRLASGESVEFLPRDSGDPAQGFELAAHISRLGFAARVICVAINGNLPYLVDENGKVPGSEPASCRPLDERGCEELLAGLAPIVIAGYGCRLDWIQPPHSFRMWQREIKPQLIDEANTARRNDYPLYQAQEWLAISGERYLLLWMRH